ncbi:MAG: hypothetical protein R3A43_02080 [Bacteroidia bacterium]
MIRNTPTFPTLSDTVIKTPSLCGVYNGNMHNRVSELGIYGWYRAF